MTMFFLNHNATYLTWVQINHQNVSKSVSQLRLYFKLALSRFSKGRKFHAKSMAEAES